jgi:hypothetical protein
MDILQSLMGIKEITLFTYKIEKLQLHKKVIKKLLTLKNTQ